MKRIHLSLISLLLFLLSACGGAAAPTPLPSVTPIPTYNYVIRTEAPSIVTLAVAVTAASDQTLDPDKVALGKGRYEVLACGSCHGDDATGTSKGVALAGTTLSEDNFINMLRTGGKLGNAHLFATNRLSDAGGKALYQYLVSLKK